MINSNGLSFCQSYKEVLSKDVSKCIWIIGRVLLVFWWPRFHSCLYGNSLYYLSFFCIPVTLLWKLERNMWDFLWSGVGVLKTDHPISYRLGNLLKTKQQKRLDLPTDPFCSTVVIFLKNKLTPLMMSENTFIRHIGIADFSF